MTTTLGMTVAQLDASWRSLRQQWEATQAVWTDSARRDFEESCWSPLEAQTGETWREMERLVQVIANARRHVP